MRQSRQILAVVVIIGAFLACFLLFRTSAPAQEQPPVNAGFVTSRKTAPRVPGTVVREPRSESGRATAANRLPGASAGTLRRADSRFPARLDLVVLDSATHLPVTNVRVTATNRATDETVAEQVLSEGRGTIDLPTGELFVSTEHPDYQERRLWIEFNSSAGLTNRRIIELRREVQVAGIVIDQNGVPVSGATVMLPTRSRQAGQIMTGTDGKFSCRLPPGPVRGAVVKATNSANFNAVVTETAPETLRITLPITYASVSFTGRVLNQKNEPMAGALIRVRLDPGPGSGYTQTTEEDGTFAFSLPVRQGGIVSINYPGARPSVDMIPLTADLQRDFVIESQPSFSVTLVTPEGKPLAKGFRVEGVGSSVSKIFKVPGDRYYATGYPIAIRAKASELGYGNSEVVQLSAYEPEVTLRIEPGGTLNGRAVDATGQPIRRFVYLLLQGKNLYLSQSLMDSPDGSFAVRHVTPGRYSLRVVADGHPDEEREISIELSRDCFVEMILR